MFNFVDKIELPGAINGNQDRTIVITPYDANGVLVRVGNTPIFLLGIRGAIEADSYFNVREDVSVSSVGGELLPYLKNVDTICDGNFYKASSCSYSGGTTIIKEINAPYENGAEPSSSVYVGLLMKPNTDYYLDGNLVFTFKMAVGETFNINHIDTVYNRTVDENQFVYFQEADSTYYHILETSIDIVIDAITVLAPRADYSVLIYRNMAVGSPSTSGGSILNLNRSSLNVPNLSNYKFGKMSSCSGGQLVASMYIPQDIRYINCFIESDIPIPAGDNIVVKLGSYVDGMIIHFHEVTP